MISFGLVISILVLEFIVYLTKKPIVLVLPKKLPASEGKVWLDDTLLVLINLNPE